MLVHIAIQLATSCIVYLPILWDTAKTNGYYLGTHTLRNTLV